MDETTLTKATISLEKVKGDIVTQTLDKLNRPEGRKGSSMYTAKQGTMEDTYAFSKSVLSAVYEGKGTIVDNSQ